MKSAQVFISYKSEELEFAGQLRDHLQAWGFTTWLDKDNLQPGTSWRRQIDQGLAGSQIVIGVVTPGAVDSEHVLNEWAWALDNRRLLLLIQLKPTDLKKFHWLGSIQWLNFAARYDFDALRSKLNDWEMLAQRMYGDSSADAVSSSPARPKPTTPPKPSSKSGPRAAMLDKVEQFWIKGMLEAGLGDGQTFQLGLEEARGMLVKHVRYDEYTFPDTTHILDVFEDMDRQLLILGAPGAGKTFLLLQLARQLIAKARADASAPIPVVLNLSSWGAAPRPLEHWLVDQLRRVYGLSRRLARQWVHSEKLVLLLDGLDEVRAEYRDQCVDAVNAFRAAHRSTDFAVCSRLHDYADLVSRLNLSGAISLQPLTSEQVVQFTNRPELTALHDLVKNDPTVHELAQTPFLLDTMATAYRDARPTTLQLALADGNSANSALPADPAEARRIHVFERFVERQLASITTYPPSFARRVLGWLAAALQNEDADRTTFYLEDLTPDWSRPAGRRLPLRLLSAALIALPILLVYGVIVPLVMAVFFLVITLPYLTGENSSPLTVSIGEALNTLVGDLVLPYLLPFTGVVSLSFAFIPRLATRWWQRLLGCGAVAVLSMVVFAPFNVTIFPLTNAIVAVILAVTLWLTPGSRGTPERLAWSWRRGFIVAAIAGIGLGLIPQLLAYGSLTVRPQDQAFLVSVVVSFALGGLLIGAWRAAPLDMRSHPNEGMRRAARNMLVISLSGILATTVANAPFASPTVEGYRGITPLMALAVLVIFWTPTILIPFALSVGGEALAAHLATRLALWREGRIPASFSPFLDAMASVGLLRKIGGGYLFRHRYLLEYFARYEYQVVTD